MTDHFAVLGNPVAHSLSPFIHNRFAQQTNRELLYEKISVDEKDFEATVSNFFSEGGKGLNITLPFKQRAFAMAEVKTARCLQAKAANTLWREKNCLYADNTDGIGLLRDLSHHLDLQNKEVLLLGAGGAARGVIGPLLEAKISRLTVANRTLSKAQELQKDFQEIQCCGFQDLKNNFDVIINATAASLGEEKIALPREILKPNSYCYDLAYKAQGQTAFVRWAEEHNCRAIDGLGMLVEQAAEAFFIWHGVMPNAKIVLEELRRNREA